MPALLRFAVLVSFLSAIVYFSEPASFKHEMSEDDSMKQPSRMMKDVLSGNVGASLSTPGFLHPLSFLRSSKRNQQQIRAKRIKRNVNMENIINGLANSTTSPRPKVLQSNSSLGNRNVSVKRVCVEANNQTNLTMSAQTRSPCQAAGFFAWNLIPGKEAKSPCVKRILDIYDVSSKEIVTELECRKATFYCPQASNGMGRCQPINMLHVGLGRILTVGCTCKP